MITSAYTLQQVVINTTAINQIQSLAILPGVLLVHETGGGIVDPSLTAVMSVKPTIPFSTTAIARALTAIGLSGLAITAANPFTGFYQQLDQGGTRKTGSTGVKLTMTYGMIVPIRLRAQHGNRAMMDFMAVARTNDGTTAPLTIAASQALSTYVAADQFFTVGKCFLNGAAIDGVKSIEYDPGIELVGGQGEEGDADGEPYVSFIAIMRRRDPMFRIRTKHIAALTGLHVAISSSTIVCLQKMAAGGTRVAAATEEHVSMTVAAGTAYVQEVTSDTDGTAESEICIAPHFDGTNAHVVVDTTAANAIPA